MGLFKNLTELMEEDTVYSSSQQDDDSSFELLLKASDANYLAYISAFMRLCKKGKKAPYFYKAIEDTIGCRPLDIQRKARDILNGTRYFE